MRTGVVSTQLAVVIVLGVVTAVALRINSCPTPGQAQYHPTGAARRDRLVRAGRETRLHPGCN